MLETLEPRLSRMVEVKVYSDQRSKVLRLVSMLWGVFRHRKHARLVLIDTFSTTAFWYAYFCGRFCYALRIPYAPILRGGGMKSRLVGSKKLVNRLLGDSAVNIAPSAYLKNEVKVHGFESILIPNALDLTMYPFRFREFCRPRLLWVRSFDAMYNPVMAVEILSSLRSRYPDACLCMVGPDKDGSVELVKRRAKELGVLDALKVTGVLRKEEWVKLSIDYDVFINTTNVDNMPVSVLEAMALGLPVVSTNVGGIPYLIKDSLNGLLARKEDYLDMSEKVDSILRDPVRSRALSLNGRQKAEEFGWNKIEPIWSRLFVEFGLEVSSPGA